LKKEERERERGGKKKEWIVGFVKEQPLSTKVGSSSPQKLERVFSCTTLLILLQ
jgi:hypothetical protein